MAQHYTGLISRYRERLPVGELVQDVTQKYRLSASEQGIALDAWYVGLPREETLRRLEVLIDAGREMGFDPTEDPMTHVRILAVRGEIQEAIRVALDDVFTRSVAISLGWKEAFSQPLYAEIVADPRVQVAMRQWQQEEAAIRGEVSAYLQDLQGAS